MDDEILTLLRENNQMLKRVCVWLDKVESSEWQTNNDMKEFVMNCVANMVTPSRLDVQQIRPLDLNQQTFLK